MKKIISIFCTIVLLVALLNISVSAAPTNSFTHNDQLDGSSTSALTREMYTATQTISASSLGLEEAFDGLTDIYCAQDGTIYLLLNINSKIILLNSDYSLKKVITVKDSEGSDVEFGGAQGFFVDTNGDIYIADTDNAQVIITDAQGVVKDTWQTPDSSLIPQDLVYRPVKVAKDKRGYYYILSRGSYYGAFSYSPEGEFLGFYGSNTVKASALDTLSFLWNKLTSNETKESGQTAKLPYSFVDFDFDSDGYMVTCTGTTPSQNEGQIRKISPGGSDILYKKSNTGGTISSSVFNFLESKIVHRNGKSRDQDIVSLAVDDEDFIFALDRTYGLIYVYDRECNLLNAFGGGTGEGKQLGVFDDAVSLAVNGTSLLVIDAERRSMTVFEITPYGQLLREAQSLQIVGNYSDAKLLWNQVLQNDCGNQLAYRGLASAAYYENDYSAAMDYAKKGLDFTVYDAARQATLTSFVYDNFVWFFALAAVLVGGIIALYVFVKKRKALLVSNQKLRTLLSVPIHPFNAYNNIKYKKQGSLLAACILTALLYIAFTLQNTASGFLFLKTTPLTYNAIYTALQTIGLILLWSICNWMISSLFTGNGKLDEIFIGTVYALLPMIVFTFLRVIMSHFLPISAMSVVDGFQTAIWIFTFFLLCVAMMTIHEYNFFEFIGIGILTVLFMVLVVSVGFLIGVLLQNLWSFIYSLYTEVVFR